MERDLDPNDPRNPYYSDPGPALGPGNTIYDRVAELYRNALGREGSPAEITQWSQGRTVNDLATIQQQIYATPEAQQYSLSRQQQPAAPKDPLVDPGTGGDTSTGGNGTPYTAPNPYSSGGLVPKDGTYPGGPPPQYSGGPGLTLPQYGKPPEYAFERFTPTTAADLLTDPGYDVRFNRGLDAVRADKAAAGVLNGGGTAKALLDYGQDSASQEFKNVDDRRLTDFNVNEGNRFKTYLSNVTTQFDTPYANAYKSALDTAGFAQGNSQFTQNSNYTNWLGQYNAWRNSRNDAFDQQFKVASY